MSKEFVEMIDDHAVVRARLIEILKLEPMTFNELAKKIGIAPITVKAFIMGTNATDLKRLTKIRNYVERTEAEIAEKLKKSKK